MSKRDRAENQDGRPPKRTKQEPPQVEDISFARQLQDLLVFRQDDIQQLRNGIASFKNFLESILYHKEEDNRGRQLSILREYLETQKPADVKDLERPFLPQLWQAWSFADQNNNDYLASSVSAVLALLVKTLSGILDLREQGLLLCRTVLQSQHLRLVKRCLDAPKHKEFVISPSLRLMTEVASFDGGAIATELYKRREQTFDGSTIRRLLGLSKTGISDDEAKRKPALRTLTLRYILSLFKFLHEGAKVDILKNRPLCNALFHHLRDDPADIVSEVLTAVEQSLLKDTELPRSSKAAILTAQNLERITSIASGDNAASEKAFAWLKTACQNPDYGILRPSGWYPPGTSKPETHRNERYIDLGLDSLSFYDRDDTINIRNTTLLTWLLTLRGQTSERERELLLACFAAAPELVAAYFNEKTMQLDPKLSNTWIGYASLLFEIVALDVPSNFGNSDEALHLPPQTTIIIENILPRPFNQKVLTKCLNQNSEMITFFALRILVVSLQKLRAIVQHLASMTPSESSGLWTEATERLQQRFLDRCPLMKDIIGTFRKIPDDSEHVLQREASTRVLRLYYEILPQEAMEEQFDVSLPLASALLRSEVQEEIDDPIQKLRQKELEHLLAIAQYSPGMRWLAKQGGLAYSPLVSLLRIVQTDPQNVGTRDLTEKVLTESNFLNPRNSGCRSPMDALIASLLRVSDDSAVWEFLDDLISRLGRQPVKYVDNLQALNSKSKDADPGLPSLLVSVLMEQAAFVVVQLDDQGKAKVAWIELFLELLGQTSDAGKLLQRVSKTVSKIPGWTPQRHSHDISVLFKQVQQAQPDRGEKSLKSTIVSSAQSTPQWSFTAPPTEPSSHPELTRWNQKDIDMAIEDGDVNSLILCLCSQHSDIRRQGSTALNKLKIQLRSSSYENAAQVSLLIGEVAETFDVHYDPADAALPYIAGTFAVRALRVQTQPQHFMYAKVNKFLIRGPEWRVSRLPSYWLSNTILGLPEEDDAYWREVQWVLDWLADALHSPQDLEILRRGDVFEKILGLWTSPGAASHKTIRERICEIVFRAAHINGGSDTLVTRAGVLSWLDLTVGKQLEIPETLREMITDKAERASEMYSSSFVTVLAG